MASKELYHLLRVLDERDIPLRRDDVAWAFDSPNTKEATTSWIHEYLTPISLLTKEELNFHEKRPSASSGLNATVSSRTLSDADFEAAISSLEQSTQAIEKQCQMLEAQKKALQDLTTPASNDPAVCDSKQAKQKKLARDKAQLDFEINRLSDSLQTKLTTSSKHCDTSVSAISNNIDRILEKDDKLLDGLQKLLPKLSPDTHQDAHLSAEIDRLCNLLTSLTIQEIQARMDTAFTTSCSTTTTTTTNGIDKKLEKQRLSLRAELSELCNEIDGLATMAVDTRFRRPLRHALATSNFDSDGDRARWTDYLTSTLHHLTTRLEVLAEHFAHLHAHHNALKQTAASLDTTLLRPAQDPRRASQPLSRAPSTPASKGLKPLRLVQAHSEQDPVTQTLRHFDIKGVPDATDTTALTATLDKTLHSRSLELRDLETHTARAISDSLAECLAKGDRDVEALVRAVYIFSRYGTTRLIEGGVEEALEGLERHTERVGALMRGVDVEEVRRGVARVVGE
ncbi:hypothetical protein EJ03DRAFT_303960 [Teratosphaeria nubilosa]|uniref:HAUS augmin-like complex subunit 3 N-terminal domain-containing protein n=1 Tax=Teratosphaeria nubilosa TaxID=161662 RepID=A0A6G1LNA8_9PEZI|nr:hypothetical protein EJ03DRAFT_303960 [Teratosphaeria nubilosa]